ncbi:PqqD family peptide modification chaperone [Dehalogenimonas sp. THU2]|uniref:PqqD family peptide modification chaperone n=1 Tax=Dehalogenimonas sp. THU2 TaxID=3151121 RepID=UPI00321B63DA
MIQKDFNIEAYDIMLSEKYLNDLTRTLAQKFALLEKKSRLEPGTEQRLYNNIYMAKSVVGTLVTKVEAAKRKIRNGETFYSPIELSHARETLNQTFSVISAAYAPTSLSFAPLEMPSFTGSFESLVSATRNHAENPFIQLYRDNLIPSIKEEKPDVIGITIAAESQLIPALTLSRILKSSFDKAHVCIGGHVVTVLADAITKHEQFFKEFFDSAILHEGELPLLKLVEALKQQTTLEDVPNLIYYDGDGIHTTNITPPLDINSLPTPCFDGLNLERYFGPEPVLPLLSSRGCYWNNCAFCGHTLGWGGPYQPRDVLKVIGDIESLAHKHGIRHFAFCDEGISPEVLSKLSDEIVMRGLSINCSTNIRLEKQFTPTLCRKMARAGFRFLSMGFESCCDRVLRLMVKGTTKSIAAEVCRNVYESGIWNHVYFMVGFPGETLGEAKETVDFLMSSQNIIRTFFVEYFNLGKGSGIYRDPEKYGVIKINDGPETEFHLSVLYSVESGISEIQARELARHCMQKIATHYKSADLLELIGYRYDKDFMLPLYLAHFEQSDPLLTHTICSHNRKASKRVAFALTLNFIPRLKPNVTIERINFNLSSIRANIIRNEASVALAHPSITIVEPESLNALSIPDQGLEILALCDGSNTVWEIINRLSRKYRASPEMIVDDFTKFVDAMVQEGIVENTAVDYQSAT